MCAGSIPAGGITSHHQLKSSRLLPILPGEKAPNRRGLVRAMHIPGAHIVTLYNPVGYTPAQIDRACAIAHLLQRGQFVLCEVPRRPLD